MTSCLTGGAYGFDLEKIVKASSSAASSSISSTLSESSNSAIAVSTRKPRTPRKRPNQTYNEAAALLSTACPAIFSVTKKNNKQSRLPNQHTCFFNEPPELLLPFPVTDKPVKLKPRDIEYNRSWNHRPDSSLLELSEGYEDDFDAESMLDEDIEEGIDSIMGNLNWISGSDQISNFDFNYNTCYGYPVGIGLRNGVDEETLRFRAVTVMNISPPGSIKSKKAPIVGEENLNLENRPRLLLKLNYDKVLEAWSDKGSPLPDIHGRFVRRPNAPTCEET